MIYWLDLEDMPILILVLLLLFPIVLDALIFPELSEAVAVAELLILSEDNYGGCI